MQTIAAISTTAVTSWSGADLATLGPIYPFVGTEYVLWIVGLVFWIGFHVLQAGIEKRELDADARATKDPARLRRVFAHEAKTD